MFNDASTSFFNSRVQVGLGVVGPAFEGAGLLVQRLGGGQAGFLVVLELRHLDLALVHLAGERLVSSLASDDSLASSMMRCSSLATMSSSPTAPLASTPSVRGASSSSWQTCLTSSFSSSSKNFRPRWTIKSCSSLVKLVFLVVQPDKRLVVRGIEQFFQPRGQVGRAQALDDGDVGRFLLQVQLEVQRAGTRKRRDPRRPAASIWVLRYFQWA